MLGLQGVGTAATYIGTLLYMMKGKCYMLQCYSKDVRSIAVLVLQCYMLQCYSLLSKYA